MYIPREIYNEIVNHIQRKEFTILTGARQTGKTTIARKLFQDLKEQVGFLHFI
jgi:predicted AAA+ superfamily ATPase